MNTIELVLIDRAAGRIDRWSKVESLIYQSDDDAMALLFRTTDSEVTHIVPNVRLVGQHSAGLVMEVLP